MANQISNRKLSINTVYFGFLFFVLSFLHVFHVCLIDSTSLQWRYIVDAILQCFLEVGLLVLLWHWARVYFPKFLQLIFIELSFLLLLAHAVDFALVRIMDMSVWFGLDFISEQTFDNFVEMLIASHVSLKSWVIGGAVVCLLLFLGAFLFYATEKWAPKTKLSRRHVVTTLGLVAALLVLWDATIPSSHLFAEYSKALPWKETFFPVKKEMLALPNALKPTQDPKTLLEKSASLPFELKRKPDIYLFVMESLREDYITPEVAPYLNQFKQENLSFDLALSSANATHNSWFSLFYSQYPFYWASIQKSPWKGGSPPLNILKQQGYKIYLYSSTRLSYFQIGDLIFGDQSVLVDRVHLFPHDEAPACNSDAQTMAQLCQDVQEQGEEGGRLFIVFLESTHFDYSSPPSEQIFLPAVDTINYVKVACSQEDLTKIQNSYRNSIHYVDSLFGRFQAVLKEKQAGEESIVIVTGDHGEEFYENGHIFHASDLCHAQTHIPLYYKFGKNDLLPGVATCQITSHMDVFPSLFHYLSGDQTLAELFQGVSIFSERQNPFVVVARYNASRAPFEFFIHNGEHKLLARFSNEKQIFTSKELQVLSIRDRNDHQVAMTPELIQHRFGHAIHTLFPEKTLSP